MSSNYEQSNPSMVTWETVSSAQWQSEMDALLDQMRKFGFEAGQLREPAWYVPVPDGSVTDPCDPRFYHWLLRRLSSGPPSDVAEYLERPENRHVFTLPVCITVGPDFGKPIFAGPGGAPAHSMRRFIALTAQDVHRRREQRRIEEEQHRHAKQKYVPEKASNPDVITGPVSDYVMKRLTDGPVRTVDVFHTEKDIQYLASTRCVSPGCHVRKSAFVNTTGNSHLVCPGCGVVADRNYLNDGGALHEDELTGQFERTGSSTVRSRRPTAVSSTDAKRLGKKRKRVLPRSGGDPVLLAGSIMKEMDALTRELTEAVKFEDVHREARIRTQWNAKRRDLEALRNVILALEDEEIEGPDRIHTPETLKKRQKLRRVARKIAVTEQFKATGEDDALDTQLRRFGDKCKIVCDRLSLSDKTLEVSKKLGKEYAVKYTFDDAKILREMSKFAPRFVFEAMQRTGDFWACPTPTRLATARVLSRDADGVVEPFVTFQRFHRDLAKQMEWPAHTYDSRIRPALEHTGKYLCAHMKMGSSPRPEAVEARVVIREVLSDWKSVYAETARHIAAYMDKGREIEWKLATNYFAPQPFKVAAACLFMHVEHLLVGTRDISNTIVCTTLDIPKSSWTKTLKDSRHYATTGALYSQLEAAAVKMAVCCKFPVNRSLRKLLWKLAAVLSVLVATRTSKLRPKRHPAHLISQAGFSADLLGRLACACVHSAVKDNPLSGAYAESMCATSAGLAKATKFVKDALGAWKAKRGNIKVAKLDLESVVD